MAIDPVCKMTVDEKKAAAISDYNGKKYYFCAKGCKIAFERTRKNTWQRNDKADELTCKVRFTFFYFASLCK